MLSIKLDLKFHEYITLHTFCLIQNLSFNLLKLNQAPSDSLKISIQHFSRVMVKQKHDIVIFRYSMHIMLELFSCQTLHPGLRGNRKWLDENLPSGPLGRVAVHSADRPLISPVSKLVITNKKPEVRALVAQKSLSSFTPWFLLRLQSINIPHS